MSLPNKKRPAVFKIRKNFSPSQFNRSGFTLIELLVVISIIGLLTTVAIVSLQNARIKSRDTRRKADAIQLQKALDAAAQDSGGVYPDTTGGSYIYGQSYYKCLGKISSQTCFGGRYSGLDSLNNSLSPFIKAPVDPKRSNEIFDGYVYSRSCHVSHAPGWGDKPCVLWQPEATISDAICNPGVMGNSTLDVCGYNCYFCALKIGN